MDIKMADPIVRVEQGKIKGKIETDIRGGTFYSFKGIPYGKPPIGELRFKAPEPAENWTGIRDCTKDGSPSFQVHQFYNTIGSEDCLHLNVYTPGLPQENQAQNTLPYLKPVMVWIHGGALINGSNKSSIHGPEFILAEDVVLVVINYRLGLLGFLSCEDVNLNVPGNAAFKDMVLALKWIKQNISNFLGDPNNVTIFGESVGAASVDALVLSPMAKGLFHKAILQSLSVITPSFCGKTLKELATDMDFKNHTEREIFDILKHSPAEKLLMIQDKLEKKIPNSMRKKYVGLIIEKPSDSAFLTISPLEIIKSGKYNNIPMIMGYNSMEGLVPQIFSAKWKTKGEFVPHFLNLTKGSTAFSLLAEKVVTHYFGNKDFSKEPFTDVFRDVFIWAILTSVKNYVNTSSCPVYMYKFDMDSSLNLFKAALGYQGPGACHGDDLGYLFHTRYTPEITPDSKEDIGQRRVCKLWTNFAKYGNPTPFKEPLLNITWEPTDRSLRYLAIGDTLRMESDPDKDTMNFWDEILPYSPLPSKL